MIGVTLHLAPQIKTVFQMQTQQKSLGKVISLSKSATVQFLKVVLTQLGN